LLCDGGGLPCLAKLLNLHDVVLRRELKIHPRHRERDVGEGGNRTAVDHVLAAHDRGAAQQLVDLGHRLGGSGDQGGAGVSDRLEEINKNNLLEFDRGSKKNERVTGYVVLFIVGRVARLGYVDR
jgi:hypothetical protein